MKIEIKYVTGRKRSDLFMLIVAETPATVPIITEKSEKAKRTQAV